MSMNLQKVPPSQSSARRTGWMKEYRRAAGFLMRKGFGSSEIRRALEEYQDSADEES